MVTPLLPEHKPSLSDSVSSPLFHVHGTSWPDQTEPRPLPVLRAEPLPLKDGPASYLLLMVGLSGRLESGYESEYLLCGGAACSVDGCPRAEAPQPAATCARCGVVFEGVPSEIDGRALRLFCNDVPACEAQRASQLTTRPIACALCGTTEAEIEPLYSDQTMAQAVEFVCADWPGCQSRRTAQEAAQ